MEWLNLERPQRIRSPKNSERMSKLQKYSEKKCLDCNQISSEELKNRKAKRNKILLYRIQYKQG